MLNVSTRKKSAAACNVASEKRKSERMEFVWTLALLPVSVEKRWPRATQELSGGDLCFLESNILLTDLIPEMKLPYQSVVTRSREQSEVKEGMGLMPT